MTEEAKENLLNYMLGKMPNESGEDDQILKQIKMISKDVYTPFLPEQYDQIKIENIVQMPQSINDVSIVYGGYKLGNSSYGFILLLDNTFQPLKSFFEYENGTKIRYIDCMYIDNDGVIYAVDDEAYTNGASGQMTSTKRFIYLNNFTQKNSAQSDYIIKLNKSYNLIDNNMYCHAISKSQNSSYFALSGGRYDADNGQQTSSIIMTLKVNTTEENEWQTFPTSGKYYRYGGMYAIWDEEDNFDFRLLLSVFEGNLTSIYLASKNENSLNYTKIYDSNLAFGIILQNLNAQVVFISEGDLYFVLTNSPFEAEKCTTYIIHYNNGNINVIYSNNVDYITAYQEQIYLFNNSNTLYIFKKIVENQNSTIFYVSNEKLDFLKLFSLNGTYNGSIIPTISRKYNLLTYFLTNSNMSLNCIAKESNIINGYNGPSYINTNSLNANSAELYSNSDLVFARNLYNKTQNGATTTSTIEIPNNYLNDTLVDQKDLMSVNNNVIINDTNGFTKNVYETVYLNFVNTISVVDQNETQPIYNNVVATKLNTSINNPTDYDNLKLTKFRINYQDGTNNVSNFQATLQNDGSYELLMTFYLSKLADTLELVSEDEETVYLIYNLANAETNKIYSFKQRVRIGG